MRNAELTARLVLITVCLIVLGIPVGLYVSGQREVLHARLAELLARHNINDYAASVRVYAIKPAARSRSY